MSNSSFSRRRILAGAGAIAAIGAVTAPVALAAQLQPDDAPLFDLIRQHREVKQVLNSIDDTVLAPGVSRMWTPEELKAHNVQNLRDRGFDKPQFIDLETIEVNNRWDDPTWRSIRDDGDNVTETWEGTRCVRTMRIVHETAASDEEIAAWKERCAARLALYKAKEEALDEAEASPAVLAAEEQLDAAYEVSDRLEAQIIAYRPLTVAGVLEKMRFYREYEGKTFGGDFEDLNWSAKMFVSALADLERLAGGETTGAGGEA